MRFDAFGFPIILHNVPMKKVAGEWFFDIRMNALQEQVLFLLCQKEGALTGAEVRFIRKYLGMTKTDFAKITGVTYPAVAKWENQANKCTKMSPAIEIIIRLFAIEKLFPTGKEFIQQYRKLMSRQIEGYASQKILPIELNIDKEKLAA